MTPEQKKALALASARLRLQTSQAPEFKPSFQAPEPGFVARVGRGVADVTQGIEQIGRRLFGDDAETAAWEAQKNAETQMYEQGQGGGFDGARLLGNIGATAPLALVPGGASAGVVGRTAAGAGMGAAGAVTSYTDTSKGDYLGQKAMQGTIGAVIGGAANAAAPAIAQGIGKVVQKLKGVAAKFGSSSDDLVVEITRQASSRGIDLSRMPDQLKAGFVSDALDQLDTTGVLDIDALARKSNLERFGFTGNKAGTVGQITRDPKSWQDERNLMQLTDIGDDLRNRFMAQNQRLHEMADEVATRISPETNVQAAGMQAREVAKKALKASQKTVGAAYDSAINTPGIGDQVVDAKALQDALIEPYAAFADNIPSPIKTRITALVDGQKAPTVQNVFEAVKLVNKRLNSPANPAEKAALSEVAKILNSQLDETAAQGGSAAQALRDASELASKRFGLIRGKIGEKSKIVEVLGQGGRADNLVDRLMGGNVDDLQHIKRFFTAFDEQTFPDIPKPEMLKAWDDIRGGVLRKMNASAKVGDPSMDMMSGFQWDKAWKSLGPERQKVFFNDEEREVIESAIEVAKTLTKAPPLEVSNKSGTGGFLMNMGGKLISRMRNMPVLRQFADTFVGLLDAGEQVAVKVSKQKQVATALNGKPYTEAQRRAFEAEALTLLNRLGGAPAAGLGSAGAVAVNAALNPPRQPRNSQPQ